MDDRIFFPLIGALALALIALATVWPQGLGNRSPGPFGRTPEQQTPEARAAQAREQAKITLDEARAAAAAFRAEQEAAAARAAADQSGEALR